MRTRILVWFGCILGLAAPVSAGAIYDVVIDTVPMIGHPAGPFTLDLQFIDGSGAGDANNTAVLGNFTFGGGSPAGSAAGIGGVSGDLASSVQMIDSSFFNEFDQSFNPGASLSFRLAVSTNPDIGSPDELSLAILDSSGFEIPTLGPGNALLTVNIGAGTAAAAGFATESTRSPPAGGPPIMIAAPRITAVSAVPEPATLLLFLGAGICVRIRRSPPR